MKRAKVASKETFARRIIDWQATHGRHQLPWQGTRDAYRIWLSEIMLQQTQVTTVLGYYERFLQRFPTVQDLAQGTLDEVLALWSGLGYYSRARNLHRCAQAVVQHHAAVFPTRSEVLETLPGIGRSTAAAIAVFSAGEQAAILDGNVKRVLSRHLGFDGDLAQAAPLKQLWAHAQALLPEAGIERYTQGLMDLGAGLCTQRRPQCLLCPVQQDCKARIEGEPQRYPMKTRKLRRGLRRHALLMLLRPLGEGCEGEAHEHGAPEIFLCQRPTSGVWGGLWSLPEFEAESLQPILTEWPGQTRTLPEIVHALTHFDWHLQPMLHRLPHRAAVPSAALPQGEWFGLHQALQMGLPAPVRSLIEVLSGQVVGLIPVVPE